MILSNQRKKNTKIFFPQNPKTPKPQNPKLLKLPIRIKNNVFV